MTISAAPAHTRTARLRLAAPAVSLSASTAPPVSCVAHLARQVSVP